MTNRWTSPSWIHMPILALVLMLGGCSWLTARATNDPRVGCSRSAGRADAVIALVGVATLVTAIVTSVADPPGEGDHTGKGARTKVLFSAGLGVAILEAVQSNYGLRVADRCQAERAKLTMTAAPGSL
jgi:predicted small integral membrane protein